MLDPALIRPGRIDRKVIHQINMLAEFECIIKFFFQIYVPPPDDKSRDSILRLELQKMPLESDLNYDILVAKTKGFSGAEVVAVCNDAALLAIDEDKLIVTHEHVIRAIDKIKPQITLEMFQFYETFARNNPN